MRLLLTIISFTLFTGQINFSTASEDKTTSEKTPESVIEKTPDWKELSSYDLSAFNTSEQEGLWSAQIHIADQFVANAKGSSDLAKAKYWYEKAATGGSTEAMYLLGQFHSYQPERNPNERVPLSWFIRAANKGHMESIKKLIQIYIDKNDFNEASLWLQSAITLNDTESLMILGDLYFQGSKDFPQDYAKSIVYFKKAADKNHASSQLRLGIIHFKGLGVEQDLVKSLMWLMLAEKNGNNVAKEYALSNLIPLMSASQIDKAKLLSEQS